MIDIRFPIGLMFSLLGLLLTLYGCLTRADPMYQKSFGVNINLYSGLLMLVFGLFLLYRSFLSRKSKKTNN
ncbi:MAG: hypothetical protein NTU44_13620 [Bacteroidetes bacterium]|nr:hypothetical protein [Bacteroidota bacterium]